MSDIHKDPSHHSKQPIAERIAALLARYRKVLLGLSIILIVAIIGSVALAQILNTRAERSAETAEQIESLWQQWQAEQQPGSDRPATQSDAARELETELRDAISETQKTFDGSYGALRASLTLAQLEWDLGNAQAALDSFLAVAADFSGSYAESISVSGAAAAAEELGDSEQARELYGRLVAMEGVPNVERARALFSLGRLAETASEPDLAMQYYNQLVDEHGDSNWTNLGRNRIIWLTSQGVGSGS